jgi:tetratricopeptide (TPR) repeat protein
MRMLLLSGILAGGILAQPSGELASEASAYIELHFLAAKRAENAGDFARAASEYQSILKRYPKEIPEAYQNLGLVYYLDRKYEEAIRTFSNGLRLRPDMVGAQLFLGASYLYTEQPEKALPHLQRAYRQKPAPESATYLGLAYVGVKQYADAARNFRFALNAAEQKDAVLYFLGDTYLKASEAVSHKLAEQNPDSKYDYFITARILDSQDWYQVAASEYLEAAGKDPLNAAIFFPLARLLAILGQEEASRLALERYRQLVPVDRQAALDPSELSKKQLAAVGPKVDYLGELRALPPVPQRDGPPPVPLLNSDVNAVLRKILAADRSGKWKQVIDYLIHGRCQQAVAALEDMQSPAAAWLPAYLEANAYAWSDDYHKAEEILEGARLRAQQAPPVQLLGWEVYQQLSFFYFNWLLQEYPQSPRAHLLRARTLNAQGKREALDEFQAAIAADSNLPEARLALVDYYLNNAKYNEALEECRRTLEIHPWSIRAKLRIGRTYVQLRQPELGIPYLRAALAAEPDDAEGHADLARGFELQNQMERAITEYRRALELDPSLNRVHYVLGRIYRKLNQIEMADREYQIFQQNESGERQAHLQRMKKLRWKETPQREP